MVLKSNWPSTEFRDIAPLVLTQYIVGVSDEFTSFTPRNYAHPLFEVTCSASESARRIDEFVFMQLGTHPHADKRTLSTVTSAWKCSRFM